MQEHNIFIQILLSFTQYPLLKVYEVKPITRQPILHQPLIEVLEVSLHLMWIEYPIDHVTAEQFHLNLILQVTVDGFVLMDKFEHVGGCRSVGYFELLELCLGYG